MKLSRLIYIAPALLTLSSCSDIKEDERLIEVAPVEVQRTVLMEEFTGQYCINCPEAHTIISQLKEQYGANFIPVSIHAGSAMNAIPESESNEWYQGLKTDDGDYYAAMWGINAYPKGVIDRVTDAMDRDKWAAALVEELAKPSYVNIALSARYNAVTNQIDIATTLEASENTVGNLQLWITESGIQTLQRVGDNYVFDYEHNHVYRAAVNTTTGEAVQLELDTPQQFAHSIAVKDLWNVANLSVVAFVYNGSGVLQAAEIEVESDNN